MNVGEFWTDKRRANRLSLIAKCKRMPGIIRTRANNNELKGEVQESIRKVGCVSKIGRNVSTQQYTYDPSEKLLHLSYNIQKLGTPHT